MSYDDIRAALSRGFVLETLYLITRLGHELLGPGQPSPHPSAAYALAVTAQKIAWYCEGYPVHEEIMAVVEAHVRPKMVAVLDAVATGGDGLVKALDELALAYGESQPFLNSIGVNTGPLSSDPPTPSRA